MTAEEQLAQLQALVNHSYQTDAKRLQENSQKMYQSTISVYERTIRERFPAVNPYPITEATMRAFLTIQKDEKHRACNTLINYIAGFAHYFQSKQLPDLTKTASFHTYRLGLGKEMRQHIVPNRKLPILPEHMEKFAQKVDHSDLKQIQWMASMSLMFLGFLRISEFLTLKISDITLEEDRVRIHIQFSKTDTTGRGDDVVILRGAKSYDAHYWVSSYYGRLNLKEMASERFLPYSATEFRVLVKSCLRQIGIEEVGQYSSHSFRRGGAHEASRRGVADSVIKAHGRWRSNCFQIYTNVSTIRAGEVLTGRLNE